MTVQLQLGAASLKLEGKSTGSSRAGIQRRASSRTWMRPCRGAMLRSGSRTARPSSATSARRTARGSMASPSASRCWRCVGDADLARPRPPRRDVAGRRLEDGDGAGDARGAQGADRRAPAAAGRSRRRPPPPASAPAQHSTSTPLPTEYAYRKQAPTTTERCCSRSSRTRSSTGR